MVEGETFDRALRTLCLAILWIIIFLWQNMETMKRLILICLILAAAVAQAQNPIHKDTIVGTRYRLQWERAAKWIQASGLIRAYPIVCSAGIEREWD